MIHNSPFSLINTVQTVKSAFVENVLNHFKFVQFV